MGRSKLKEVRRIRASFNSTTNNRSSYASFFCHYWSWIHAEEADQKENWQNLPQSPDNHACISKKCLSFKILDLLWYKNTLRIVFHRIIFDTITD
jgi:hypothetical protein